ncbi:LysR family transcriptional regulator [Pseudomonas atacamensis]|uniref:LysR family transcriptional regulator n=1 Tax=Pseudomonas atacamensis TaxID=2565368 RepID=A0AAQ2D6Q7_9PSED|nr:LysR family transcriptional regulator [Pseudomonas atacamensis]THF25787.1 LysR family transcriptional regulator [Pseudomonas atacamensis]
MRHSAYLSKLEIFVKVVETGGLSQAGRELNLSPSAVSKSLAQLEAFLGTALIKRSTRNITLTESGKNIFHKVTLILQDVESTINAAKQYNEPMGSLKVTTPIAFSHSQLAKIMGAFTEKHPKINTTITLEDRCANLSEEEFDVALRITDRTTWDYPAKYLTEINWVYCASQGYLNKNGDVKDPQHLEKHCCLVYPSMTTNGAWSFIKDGLYSEVKVKGRIVSNSSLALIAMAVDDCGIVCAPAYAVADRINEGTLKVVLPEYKPAISHSLYAMYFKTKVHNPSVRAFIDFLASKFEHGAPWDSAF